MNNDDKMTSSTSTAESYPQWPLTKIRTNLEKYFNTFGHPSSTTTRKTTFYVLLTTGAFNPVHRGHVEAFRHCAINIPKQITNEVILGSFICPSSDHYLKRKFAYNKNDYYFPAHARFRAIAKAVEGDPLIAASGFELSTNDKWKDFPEVCDALQTFLDLNAESQVFEPVFGKRANHDGDDGVQSNGKDNGNRWSPEYKLEVIYCCGSDLFENCHLANGIPISGRRVCKVACTPRGEAEVAAMQTMISQSGKLKNIGSQGSPASVIPNSLLLPPLQQAELAEMSSTKARQALKLLMGVMDPEVIAAVLEQ